MGWEQMAILIASDPKIQGDQQFLQACQDVGIGIAYAMGMLAFVAFGLGLPGMLGGGGI